MRNGQWIPVLICHRHMIRVIMDRLENRKETFQNSFHNPYSQWTAPRALCRHPVTILRSVNITKYHVNLFWCQHYSKIETHLSNAFLLTTWWRDEPTPFAKNKSGIHSELISFSSTEILWKLWGAYFFIILPVVILSVKFDKFNRGSFQNCLKKTSISYRMSSWFSFDIDPT